MSSEEFLNTANNTPKKLGHNKYQIEIECLKQQTEKLTVETNEKDMKIGLMKKTIENLQKELDDTKQQCNSNTTPDSELKECYEELEAKNNSIEVLKSSLESLQEQLLIKETELKANTSALEELLSKYTSLSDSNTQLQTSFDKQTSDLSSMKHELSKAHEHLSMERNIAQELRQKFEDVKLQIADYQNQYEESLRQNDLLRQELEELKQQTQPTQDFSQITGGIRVPRQERIVQRRRR